MKLLKNGGQDGFTIVELAVGVAVLGILAVSVLGLFSSMVNSALLAKRKAVALTLATGQMEYLKSLPYNSLAVAGGSIYSASPLPATNTQTINGVLYTIKTDISYVDDAFDGCGSYPNQTLKQTYCRNYPPPSGAPATDQNAADYKIAHVAVYAPSTKKLAEVDTQISARVAETASTTGALFVTVVDDAGTPISGATVQVTNTTLTPNVNLSDSSDSNGIAIFYGLVPDSNGYDYVVSASSNGYSSLTTIAPSGPLQPTYPSQQIFTQLSSFVTLTLKPQGANSLLVETTDINGNPLSNVKVYAKGGYKKYTATTDTSYYYDNFSPADTRPTTNGSGLATISNLVPGSYIFCGDAGATSCTIGGTTYYLAAAIPYSGGNSFNPVSIPTYLASSPPTTVFSYNSLDYLQKVRLMLTTSSSFPRITSLTPDDASTASGLSNVTFQVDGANLPCDSVAANCDTTVRLTQGANNYTATCTGTSAGLQLSCSVNLSVASIGSTQLIVIANGQTFNAPGSPLLGGLNVTP